MAQVTPEVLARCLDDLVAGRSTLDDYVLLSPMVAADLQSLVGIVQSIAPPSPVSLDVATQARLRAGLMRDIAQVQRLSRESWSQRLMHALWDGLGRLRVVPVPIQRLPGLVAVGIIVLTTAFGGGVVYASEGTIPGDTLYSVKITVESVQLALAPNDEARAEDLVNRADQRLSEITRATESERGESARMAADSYAREVVEASRLLSNAASHGVDVTFVASRVSVDLTRQQRVLLAVEERASDEERSALAHADESLKNGLTVARRTAGEAASPAVPVETRLAANPASEPTATNSLANTVDEAATSPELNQVDDASRSAVVALPSPTPSFTAVTQPIVRPIDDVSSDESSRKSDGAPAEADQPSTTDSPTDAPASTNRQTTREPNHTRRPTTKNPSSTPVPKDPGDDHKPPPNPVPTATPRPEPKPTQTRVPTGSGHPTPDDDHHDAARARTTSAAPDQR